MHKILYAINHRQTEDAITTRIKDSFMAVGAVTYKEAVLEQLTDLGADTLLIRETLPGSSNLEGLLKRVRVEHPEVRIVVICSERQKKDPFLQTLVGLGIYDIINSDKPTLTDIISYIQTPRTYRDAAQYGIGLPEAPGGNPAVVQRTQPPPPPPQPEKKSGGFLSDLKKGFAALKKPTPGGTVPQPVPSEPTPPVDTGYTSGSSAPQVNYDLLRETIKESEARKAQSDLDNLIRDAVIAQTSSLTKENAELKKQLDIAQTETAVAESHAASVVEELNSIRAEKDKLSVTLTDTRRDMQGVIDMYEAQLKALHDPTNTPEWYSNQTKLWESEKATLTKSLADKKQEAEELSLKCELLIKQAETNSSVIAGLKEQLQRAQDMQLSEKGSEELITKLRAEASESKASVLQLKSELKKLQDELAIVREGGPDYSFPTVDVPLLPDDTIYNISTESPQTVLVVGAKHGVGTTTVAMNIAASLAGRGYKTLLMEVNGDLPMCNQFFEFTHIPYGIDEAINSVAAGKLNEVDRSIIRPHGLRPAQGSLYKTYKKLPAGLHFMLFSNDSLVNHSYKKNPLVTEATMYTLLSYLTKRQQYSHVILDIQCDDYQMLESILNSGYQIDKLCVVLSQDPHAVATAGSQITTLARAHASSLVAGGEFILNKFNPGAPINQKKVETMLHLASTQISKVTEDSVGYLSAAAAGLPYIVNGGNNWMEYDVLRTKAFPNS